MQECTLRIEIATSGDFQPRANALAELLMKILPPVIAFCLRFDRIPVTPRRALEFERELFRFIREIGRALMESVVQNSELNDIHSLPPELSVSLIDRYRRRSKKTRLKLLTLFGEITAWRVLYEACLPGERSLFLLDRAWGIGAGHVSVGLNERLVVWANDHTQQSVLRILYDEYGAKMSVPRLRTVLAGTAERVAPMVHSSRVTQVLQLLELARRSCGKHAVTLAVGRDGCSIPIRSKGYKVASVATISVLDRRGRRIGTCYLAQMPHEHQTELSRELDAVLRDVLRAWTGSLPRLVYITDSGQQETNYWRHLKRLKHPLTGKRLPWRRIADFYHVCQYVSRLSEVLFDDEKASKAWFRRMRKWLREKPNGARRVIHSAAALLKNRDPLSRKAIKEYTLCTRYLSKRLEYLNYADYRRRGLPIGSGVTEAACKTVFTQRFKRSGMQWTIAGGHVVLQLRTLVLSGIWPQTFEETLDAESDRVITVTPTTKPDRSHLPATIPA